jgi:hypothetical protein
MYFNREFVAEGGLMSYGNDVADAYRRAGFYAGEFSRTKNLPIYRSIRPPGSSSRSTSRLPRLSALKCRPGSQPAPTR